MGKCFRPGPVFSEQEDRPALLVSCYRESLRVADELGARTVAFPAVSAGIYGWPMDDAARIAVQTVRETETAVEEVTFVLFGERAYEAFAQADPLIDSPVMISVVEISPTRVRLGKACLIC